MQITTTAATRDPFTDATAQAVAQVIQARGVEPTRENFAQVLAEFLTRLGDDPVGLDIRRSLIAETHARINREVAA